MINFLLKIKSLRKYKAFSISNGMKKLIKIQKNRGMTYVELIVVLSIFSVMTSIVLFNYGEFQARVDIKNLASDIALKIVEAQKLSLSGKLPLQIPTVSPWKPSYGVYFDITNNPTQFIYFVDLNNLNGYEAGAETLNVISITRGNYIFAIERCASVACDPGVPTTGLLSIVFKRPNSSAIFTGASVTGSQYVKITIKSPKSATATIKIYPSGRVQVN